MAQTVPCEILERVAVVRLSNPPMNALSRPLLQALSAKLRELAQDAAVDAVVIAAKGQVFSIGLDIRELDDPKNLLLSDVCGTIGDYPKPVVAALRGMVLGGGMELALACHARVAQRHTVFGFPDIALGLSPSAGGTQLLPRLVGAKIALDLLLGGHSAAVQADGFKSIFNHLVEDDEVGAASELARSMVGQVLLPTTQRVDGFAEGIAFQKDIRERRKGIGRDGLADVAERIVDCVEAAQLLPFAAGREFEAAAFEDCRGSEQSRALRHAYFAERRAANMPELGEIKPSKINTVGLIGGGAAASMIALASLDGGRNVLLFERNQQAMDAAYARIKTVYDTAISAKRLSEANRDDRMARLRCTDDLTALSDADLIIEAVADNAQTKAQVFAAIDKIAKPEAVLATNSLILPLAAIADNTDHPERVLGLHMHMPAHVNRLAEVILHDRTAPQAVANAVEFLHGLNKVAVHVDGGQSGIGERVTAALRDACAGMLRRGSRAWDVDQALKTYGYAMGPLQQMDMIGLDVCLARAKILSKINGFPVNHIAMLEQMVAAGRLGVKSGAGFHDWSAGNGAPGADETLGDILNSGDKHLKSGDILLRCIAAMANAGARILREDVALRPSDIDAVMILAYHYPRWRGGPMKAADMLGVFDILQGLKRLQEEDQLLYSPDPGFAALARNHENFDALNKVGRKRRKIPG